MKKSLTVTISLILLISPLFFPISNAYAEKVTYKWGKITYKSNHIGKLVVTKNTNLYYWDKEYDELVSIGTLKKGEERPVYATQKSEKNGELLNIGNGQLVKSNKNISFKKPTKQMKETVGKERVWLRNPYFIYDSKGNRAYVKNLQEAIILSRKTDELIDDQYTFKLKIASSYYTMENVDGNSIDEYYMKSNPFKKYKFNKSTWDLIKVEKVQIGMTENQVLLSWGYPNDINSYSSSFGSSKQWIYGDVLKGATYLYFKNGKLESWQKL